MILAAAAAPVQLLNRKPVLVFDVPFVKSCRNTHHFKNQADAQETE